MRKGPDRGSGSDRDSKTKSDRDSDRDSIVGSVRDSIRDSKIDSALNSNRDSKIDSNRDSVLDSKIESVRDSVLDSEIESVITCFPPASRPPRYAAEYPLSGPLPKPANGAIGQLDSGRNQTYPSACGCRIQPGLDGHIIEYYIPEITPRNYSELPR